MGFLYGQGVEVNGLAFEFLAGPNSNYLLVGPAQGSRLQTGCPRITRRPQKCHAYVKENSCTIFKLEQSIWRIMALLIYKEILA